MKMDRAHSLEPERIDEWIAYDPAWLVDLACEQKDHPWLAEALSNCRTARWESRAYVAFVDNSNPNAPGSPWQFQESIILEHRTEGDLVLDVLVGGRVGGVEFLSRL